MSISIHLYKSDNFKGNFDDLIQVVERVVTFVVNVQSEHVVVSKPREVMMVATVANPGQYSGVDAFLDVFVSKQDSDLLKEYEFTAQRTINRLIKLIFPDIKINTEIKLGVDSKLITPRQTGPFGDVEEGEELANELSLVMELKEDLAGNPVIPIR